MNCSCRQPPVHVVAAESSVDCSRATICKWGLSRISPELRPMTFNSSAVPQATCGHLAPAGGIPTKNRVLENPNHDAHQPGLVRKHWPGQDRKDLENPREGDPLAEITEDFVLKSFCFGRVCHIG